MLFKILLFLILSSSLWATKYLQSDYYTKTDSVMLSDIIQNPTKDFKLYDIRENKHTKRVKAEKLLKLLKKHGYTEFDSKDNYIQFNKKSPINLQKIREKLIQHYKSKYKNITIKSLTLEPKTYLETLPSAYAFGINKRAHLSNKDYCYIYTPEKKKIFFSYVLHAFIDVYVSKSEIDRGTELSNLNTKKKSIMLNKFRALPLSKIEEHTLEAKHRIRANSIITSRDAIGLYLVRRGAMVSVSLKNSGINISFLAEALTSGREGDIITVQNKNDKKIKVRVSGHNRAEM